MVKNSFIKYKKLFVILFSAFLLLSTTASFADPSPTTSIDPKNPPCTTTPCPQSTVGNSSFDLNVKIQNPLKATNIQEAVKLFMGILLKLAIPVIVFMFLWVGLSYILALGNAEKIKKVHNMFLYTVIGTLLVLGAWTITNAIVGTINAVVAP